MFICNYSQYNTAVKQRFTLCCWANTIVIPRFKLPSLHIISLFVLHCDEELDLCFWIYNIMTGSTVTKSLISSQLKTEIEIHVLIADLRLNIDLRNAGARESFLPEEHNKTAWEFSLHCPSTLNENTLSWALFL